MNPNHDRQPEMSLPQPVAEAPVATPDVREDARQEVGTANAAPMTQVASTATPALPLPVDPSAGATPVPPMAAPAQQQSSPMIADDADLIEKEWVIKAKQIVERTKHDPYTQSREMNKFKANYMKKRYNKDVKVPEE